MTPITELAKWAAQVQQMDVGDPVTGGENGPINQSLKSLSNRTTFLRALANQVITAAALTPDGDNTNQLQQAIAALIAAGTAQKANQLTSARKIGGVDFNGTADVYLPVSAGYIATQQYAPGDLVKVDGVWYECYHPDGCLGKDPRIATNRPGGWTDTNEANPYHWLKIGPWLSLPETGSPIYLPSTSLREGLIKYRNDGSLHKSKFWRLAQLYPSLVSGNYIQIADLRGEFLRGLDDGRGVDASRVINSAQSDAIRDIVGDFTPLYLYNSGQTWGLAPTGASGAFSAGTQTVNYGAGTYGNALANIGDCKSTEFKASRVVPTASENRPRNVAMLIATRI